ncbi:MAG: sulfurtransferase, partial [Oligoflexus sp.]|nr:sulfurtransferase [Oligoflexus sp.]
MDVVTICHHGVRSLSAAFYLREAGLPRVRSLKGGLDEWALTVDKEMPRY